MIHDSLEELVEGVKVAGQHIESVCLAHYQAMTARTAAELQHMMKVANRMVKEYRMGISIKMTRVMKIGRKASNMYVMKD